MKGETFEGCQHLTDAVCTSKGKHQRDPGDRMTSESGLSHFPTAMHGSIPRDNPAQATCSRSAG